MPALGESRKSSNLVGAVKAVAEVDESSDDDDDLDVIPLSRGGHNDAVSGPSIIPGVRDRPLNPSLSEEEEDGKHEDDLANERSRIAFDEDEDSDAAYNSFKRRKTEKRKQDRASKKRSIARKSSNSLVGRKSRDAGLQREARRKRWDGLDLVDELDDEIALMETTLPGYLQKRRSDWQKRRDKLGSAGLQVPPGYDDIYFSDDDKLENLKERPNLPKGTRQGQYKDIDLPYSAGVIPAPLAQWLREYQVEGVEFLHELFVYQKGGILGDDMGLGKTIQVIAFLTAAFGKTGDERDWKRMRKMRRASDERWYPRVLIIAPGGLMANWKTELERWGWWQVYTYHGLTAAKDAALAAAQKGRLEIMITTYTTYRLNQSAINGIRWDCIVADECHVMKEKGAEITKAMNDVNALCRIGLTGTAIQNKYEELWTLLNWTNPGHFGPLSMWKQAICLPLKLGQSHDATISQLSKGRRTAEKLVRNLLPPVFKRRMKSLIADQLPKKSDQVVFCPLTETQTNAYNNFCDSELVQIIQNASQPCVCGSGKKQGWCCYTEYNGKPWHAFVFPCLVALRNLANHVAMLIPAGETDRDKHDRDLDKMKTALPEKWGGLYQQRDNIMNFANTEFCGKWKVLKKLLKYWYDNGDKVLVFSHSVRLLKMLNMLFKATTSYNVAYLDGGMTYEERHTAVDEYNSDPRQFVFLLSTKAGGIGLNITSANKVVVVDPNWNPSYDLQAQDRAYRIGQTRDVQVFRLVSVGTVEEIVYARQIYKQQQANIGYNASVERRYFRGVQDQKDQKGEIFGLGNLFAPISENVRLREIVNKTNVAETRAGVEIAGLDLEVGQEEREEGMNALTDESKEDAAMSQLAADIIDAPAQRRKAAAVGAKRKDAVQAILASAGVDYTHENAEVIGTSKIETKISSRAQKAGNDVEMNSDLAFAREQTQGGRLSPPEPTRATAGRCEPVEPSARRDHDIAVSLHVDLAQGHGDSDELELDLDLDAGGGSGMGKTATKIEYRYRPPEDVRRRQFCSMARRFGYVDITEFALVVEGWTQEQRRDFLERFYLERRLGV